jgi:hypothetical protein
MYKSAEAASGSSDAPDGSDASDGSDRETAGVGAEKGNGSDGDVIDAEFKEEK